MFDQVFLSPQVKLSMTSSKKHGVCELPHELLSHFRLKILGNYEISEKSQNFIEL